MTVWMTREDRRLVQWRHRSSYTSVTDSWGQSQDTHQDWVTGSRARAWVVGGCAGSIVRDGAPVLQVTIRLGHKVIVAPRQSLFTAAVGYHVHLDGPE